MTKSRKNKKIDSSIRTKPLPWELPGAHYLDQKEINFVTKVIRSKSLFRFYGPDLQNAVNQLESKFASYLNKRYALAVSSGTAALHIALSALQIGPGDEVLVPGYLWISCLSAIIKVGAIPRLVDIDDSFCMSIEDLKNKINKRSKVILYVHMSGAMGEIDKVMKLAKKYNLKVLEDCAQTVGASLHGKPAGSFGDIATYSFQLNKNMTSGEGGLIVCNNEKLYQRCFAIHDLGYARNKKGRLDTSNKEIQLWGIGARMSEVTGAIALIQLGKLNKIVSAMRNSKHRIINKIKNISDLTFRRIKDPSGDSGAFLIVTFPSENICRKFVSHLHKEGINGPAGSVACVVVGDIDFYWYYNTPSLINKSSNSPDRFPWTHPLNKFSNKISYRKGILPVCDDLAMRSMKLAIASNLTKKDETDIINAFFKVAKKLKIHGG